MSLHLIETPRPRTVPGPSVLREVEPPKVVGWLSAALLALFLAIPVILAFVPWRQSVSAKGKVVGYAPLDRQFNIEAPISGRVREWYVAEGSKVQQGERVARISDNDLQYVDALKNQLASIQLKEETAENEANLYRDVATRFETVREMAVRAAESGVDAAKQKVSSEEQEVAATTAALNADKLQFERLSRLVPQGLTSSREFELAEQKYKESLAKRQKAEAALAAVRSDLKAKEAYFAEVKAKTQAELEKARAEVQKAHGKVAEYSKEIQDTEVKLRRQHAQDIVAPRDGTILRLLVNQGSEQVKEGDAIAVIVPEATELAVELWVDGNDTPLIQPGDSVRLQFEGWPAVQFAGWPSVAVGSFGGRVALIDSADNGKGKFRILVKRDGDVWPSPRYLKQGVRTKGWVLLREVRLGYEVWRRLNGFPATISDDEPVFTTSYGSKDATKSDGTDTDDDKKPKVKRPK